VRRIGQFFAGFTIGALVGMPGLAPTEPGPWFRRGKRAGAAAFVAAAAALLLVLTL
jgi:hypothetical protein